SVRAAVDESTQEVGDAEDDLVDELHVWWSLKFRGKNPKFLAFTCCDARGMGTACPLPALVLSALQAKTLRKAGIYFPLAHNHGYYLAGRFPAAGRTGDRKTADHHSC